MTERETTVAESQEAALIAELRAESPGAVRLAEVVSFAVLVEPRLLRAARLKLLKDVDAGAEADLWLSRLVQSRGPDGIVLLPRVAELLRLSLAANPDPTLLEEAWRLTEQMHAHLPPTLKLEESINRLTVNPDERALADIEAQLQEVAATLVQEAGREGLANWAARALPRLPEAVRRLEPARVLSMASYLRLGGPLALEDVLADPAGGGAGEELPEWVAWALPKNLPGCEVGVRLTGEGVEFGPPEGDDHRITLPATSPLIVEVSWDEAGVRRFRQALFRQGERRKVAAPLAEIRLRTILGERYSLTPLPDTTTGGEGHKVMPERLTRHQCYVAMPFGRKRDPTTEMLIDFDEVYHRLIRPALERAGFEALRVDETRPGGIIDKPHFERLLFSDFVLVDLTTNNANVFYELGLRHAVRPGRTVLVMAEGGRMPFDLGGLRVILYQLDKDGRVSEWQAGAFADRLAEAFRAGPETTDSPVFHLFEGYAPPDLSRVRSEVLREKSEREEEFRRRLERARREGAGALRHIEEELGDLKTASQAAVYELLRAYGAARAWREVLELIKKMPRALADSERVQLQRGVALSRSGLLDEATEVLTKVTREPGASAEAWAALGRVYKELWMNEVKRGYVRGDTRADAFLERAIDAYLRAYDMDLHNPAPGVNALTLLAVRDRPDARRESLLPVVRYAAERRLRGDEADFWSYAALVDLAAIEGDLSRAKAALDALLSQPAGPWQFEAVLTNLRALRQGRNVDLKVLNFLERGLSARAGTSAGPSGGGGSSGGGGGSPDSEFAS